MICAAIVASATFWRKQAVSRFLKVLRQMRPHVVGFSAMTFQYDTAVRFAALTRQVDPTIQTVLGGYHATLSHEEIAHSPEARYWDFIIRGEGDVAFRELLDGIDGDREALGRIGGLSWQQDGAWRHNEPRPLEDLSTIRIPARDKRIASGFHMYFRRADVIETSRGKSFRVFPIERVLADIEDAYSRGARHIFCTDDNITLDMDRFEELLDGVISLKLTNLVFTTQASPIGFARRPGIARKMVDAGFVSVFLGIENASAKSLRAMRKPNTLELIRRGVAELQSADITVIAGLINGLPHGRREPPTGTAASVAEVVIRVLDDVLELVTTSPRTATAYPTPRACLAPNRCE